MVNALKDDKMSAEEFETTWAACSQYRLKEIRDKCSSVAEALEIWPQYKDLQGCKLVSWQKNNFLNIKFRGSQC